MPKAAARTFIRAGRGSRPSDKWSLGNRLLMLMAGTEDARGYQQWRAVGRQVRLGAKAIYILAPLTRRITRKVVDPETGEERQEETVVVTGFRPVPVFRLEDTVGAPLPPEPDYSPPQLPPLHEVAERFGVKVEYRPSRWDTPLGQYEPGVGRITLFTHDPDVFFHELAHAVHSSFRALKAGQQPDQELVAETAAAVLCELYGYRQYHWHAWRYLERYAAVRDAQGTLKAVMRVLGDVEEVVCRVLAAAEPRTEAA
ncbi:MAG: ArdC family protein [Bacillota bacterium]